jgi:hypothetical protein
MQTLQRNIHPQTAVLMFPLELPWPHFSIFRFFEEHDGVQDERDGGGGEDGAEDDAVGSGDVVQECCGRMDVMLIYNTSRGGRSTLTPPPTTGKHKNNIARWGSSALTGITDTFRIRPVRS